MKTENKWAKVSLVRGETSHSRMVKGLLILYDLLSILGAYFLALLLRFDGRYSLIPTEYFTGYLVTIGICAVLTVGVFWHLHLYHSIWRFASYVELLRMVMGTICSLIIQVAVTLLMGYRMPLSYYVFGIAIQFILTMAVRFSYRFILLERSRKKVDEALLTRIMIIGAGNAGQQILRDINRSRETVTDKVVCFIDDNPNKWNRSIEGVPIVGGRDEIFKSVEEYKVDQILIAIPSASLQERRELINLCSETKCKIKQLPGTYQFLKDEVHVSNMRDISVEDLLGRDPIKADMKEVFEYISGKVVMVTGGGGSIGSELCRQIASHSPKPLIIFDVYENNAYDIQLELRETHPELDLVTLIGSVRDSRKIFDVFQKYHPDIVYHAAAHKHVPLMEDSPCESIKNNAIGTYKTAYAAMIHGCQRFVLISTDKAVNPTNIMGASKRLCEMIIQSFDAKIKAGKANEIPQLFTHSGIENADKDGTGEVFKNIKTQFVAVRFGNVLGSNGSVIPIFKKQIEKGGPVTVTHPDIIRYFMTIPEAVSLVMLAGTYAKGGEIFVLDMGSPVKIDTLARNLIRMSGLKPDVDIKIEYSGLRPGEKLYEEKLMAEEGLEKTENDLIHIGKPLVFDTDEFLEKLDGLMEVAYKNKDDIREYVQEMVGTYKPA